MRTYIFLINLLVFGFILKPVDAYTQEELKLDDAIRLSLENNYAIKVVLKTVEISDNNLSIGNSGMLPQINANGSVSNSNQDSKLELSTGQNIDKKDNVSNALRGSVDLNWTIFDGFGMFVSYNRLKELKELGDIQAQVAIENTINALISVFYECLRLQHNLNAFQENLVLSSERLQRIEDKYSYGAAVQLEVLKATVDRNSDSSTYLQTLIALNSLKRNLNFLMGRDPSTEFSLLSDEKLLPDYELGLLHETALKSNSSINQGLQNQKISELEYKLIKSSRLPRISLTANYGYNKSTADAGIMTLNQNVGLTAGVGASINLFDGFKKNTQIQNARVNMEIQQIQLDELKSELEMNLQNALENYQRRLEIWKMELESYSTAQQNFNRTSDNYKLGISTSIELREAQLNLLRTKNGINDAYFQAKLAESQLHLLTGRL
ncbi:TolC family protein, partial [Bacteroidota bacterium]